jgi:uncharacterized repeat protein (TIGR03847 family)
MSVTEFDPPDRFIADTVGPPGERTFFLQATRGGRVMSVSLEKEQVSVLGQRIAELLEQVAAEETHPDAVAAVDDVNPMETPIEDEFRVQSLSLAWDAGRRRVIIEAYERAVPEEIEELAEEADLPELAEALAEEELGPGQVMRVVLEPARARAFAARCARVVAAGRRTCPFCGQPLDPGGHVCPRANGYRR